MKKTVSKKTKKAVAPVKAFVAGQLAFYDKWDDGRGNSSTITSLVLVRSVEKGNIWGPDAVVINEDGSVAVVAISNLRHLPEAFCVSNR